MPITSISSKLANTPVKNVVFPDLLFQIIPFPPSVQFAGTANLGKVNLGLEGTLPNAKVNASLGATGFYFIFSLENLKLPLNLGIIHKAQMRIGKPS